jgi:hypothetical protein
MKVRSYQPPLTTVRDPEPPVLVRLTWFIYRFPGCKVVFKLALKPPPMRNTGITSRFPAFCCSQTHALPALVQCQNSTGSSTVAQPND